MADQDETEAQPEPNDIVKNTQDKQPALSDEQASLPDLGINVSDDTQAGEHFGP